MPYARPMANSYLHLQVSTVAESRDAAAHLASTAVAARLAASAQVYGPVASFFWHKGEQGESEEWQVILKTTAARFPELQANLLAEHTWENPEITALPLVAATAEYLAWLEQTVSSK
jgi:periplasmic divalent cation tolerance protein